MEDVREKMQVRGNEIEKFPEEGDLEKTIKLEGSALALSLIPSV